MPSQSAAHRMVTVVKTIAAERREVDPSNEGDLAVHDDELLVVAVHRALMGIERTSHPRAADAAPRARLARRLAPG